MPDKNLVTIDISTLALIEKDGDKFLIDARAEDALLALLELEQKVEDVKDLIKTRLGDEMRKLNCQKIEGENVKVSLRFYGERYEVDNRDIALELGMAKKVESIKPDTKTIDEYVKDTGDLPEGIKLRERKESVTISEVKAK
jgi:hypothetical protein